MTPRILATAVALSTALLAGCAVKLPQPITGYLCCNQAGAGWISSENIQGGVLVPFGQRVQVDSIKRQRYGYGSIGDAGFGFSDDYARSEAETTEWLRQIIVPQDPAAQFNTWPAPVRQAVSVARILPGMTRAQVAMAIGYPARSLTPKLDVPVWKYWTAAGERPVELHFDAAGVLTRTVGEPVALRMIEQPQ